MNTSISASGPRLTSSNRSHPSQNFGKSAQDDSNFQLTLKTAIGTTTSSSSSFDSHAGFQIFAVCAGSAVVVSHVNRELNITQRLFRAGPRAQPLNEISLAHTPTNSPTTTLRSRLALSMRGSGYGANSGLGNPMTESPSKGQVNKRTREATCLSLSPCGKYLAVGERGKTPRILIFSMAADSLLDIPLSVLNEHSFGVRSIAFSFDSRWLCSLGDLHDGFVYVWSINEKTGSGRLHSSNKCQNAQNIGWVGHSIVSFGVRHVKVWRMEAISLSSPSKSRCDSEYAFEQLQGSPAPRTLQGRNCLLGPLMDSVFTCFVAISKDSAVLCTDRGDVCLLLLDESEQSQRLLKVAQMDFSITCITLEKRREHIWIGGKDGNVTSIPLCGLNPSESVVGSLWSSEVATLRYSDITAIKPNILAIGFVLDRVITVDSDHTIELRQVEISNDIASVGVECKRMPAHDSAVLGVSVLHQPNKNDSDFLTWSVSGVILFWLFDGSYKGVFQIELDQSSSQSECDPNQLKVVRASCFDDFYVSGDRNGVLRLVDCAGVNVSVIKAHNGDINDIAICQKDNDNTIIVSCGRDRTLQVFRKTSTELLLVQTILDHVASVNSIVFLADGSTLLSSSSDRTIVVRTIAVKTDKTLAVVPVRVIALKASPVAMSVSPSQPSTLVVSTMDRQIQKYDLVSGRLFSSLKASDSTGNDTVILSSLLAQSINYHEKSASVLLGVSSSDRSIRLYEYENGLMLAKEHGQLMVSSIAYSQQESENGDVTNLIISAGLDGTIMIWDLSVQKKYLIGTNEVLNRHDKSEPVKTSSSVQPLRRILSKSEISDFQKSLEFVEDPHTPTPIRSQSPSRIHKNPSRSTLANVQNTTTQLLSTKKSPIPSAIASIRRKPRRNRSQTPPSPNTITLSNSRRPSSDGRHRKLKAGDPDDLNSSAEQLCNTLRDYRKKLSESNETLKTDIISDLEHELSLLSNILKHKVTRTLEPRATIPADLLDEYLARIIDERLAVKAKAEVENPTESNEATESSPKRNGGVES